MDRKQKKKNQCEEAYKLRLDGLTFSEIGDHMGVDKQRASILYREGKRRAENPCFSYDLSPRLLCALRNSRIDLSVEPLKEFYEKCDKLRTKWPQHYGWKGHQELAALLGLPKPEKFSRSRICPHCGKPV